MPEDIATVFAQAKSVAGIADFYQVPPHTATGWIRTARKRGLIPETTRRRSR
jgi:transposase-like protein